MSENKCYCDNCGEEGGAVFHCAELPFDIASASKGESASLCRNCIVILSAPVPTRVCQPLDSDAAMIALHAACKQADAALGRQRLPGCGLSAVSLGMMCVAYVRSRHESHSKAAERLLNSAFRAVGVDEVRQRGMAVGVGFSEALAALGDYIADINAASNEERPGVTEGAWRTAVGYALDLTAEEGWVCHDPFSPGR